MKLPIPVVILVLCLIAAFAIICGLGAMMLAMKKNQDTITAIIAGFAAAGVATLIAVGVVGAVNDML